MAFPRALAVGLLFAFLLVASPALGQTLTNPISGSFEDIYIVAGRVIDGKGMPTPGARIVVELDQSGSRLKPFLVGTNCFGDFIATLDIRDVSSDGRVKLRLQGAAGGVSEVTQTIKLDPYLRRSDVVLQAEGEWTKECTDQQTAYWPVRVSVTGRVVNRSSPYTRNGTEYHSVPYQGPIGVTFWDTTGTPHCPPATTGGCEVVFTDVRGDFRYSFTFNGPRPAAGHMNLETATGSWNATVDSVARIASFGVDISGRGPPPQNTPLPGLGLALIAIALSALAFKSRPRR